MAPVSALARSLRCSPSVSAGRRRPPKPTDHCAAAHRHGRHPVRGVDLATSWHSIGIAHTRLGNASLFGNSGSLILMVWGLIAARRLPRAIELAAILAAVGGAAVLRGRLARNRPCDLDRRSVLAVSAGAFDFFGILLIQRARGQFESWRLLFIWALRQRTGHAPQSHSGCANPSGLMSRWPLVALAFCSQVAGQGLIVFALRHFSALIIGVVSAHPARRLHSRGMAGVWRNNGRRLDALGMALIASALLLGRLRESPAR